MRKVRKARHDLQCALQEDSCWRVQAAGFNIEGLLAAARIKEAWDDLARWYCQAQGKQGKQSKREKELVGRRWELVVRLFQVMFRDRTVPVEIAWDNMVLILKGKGWYRGIGLVKVMWNVCVVVVNCRLKGIVVLHDALHGFRSGRGVKAVMLEANLAQQLTGLAHKPLF